MTHIEQARDYQRELGDLYASHPRETGTALRGILHALLALHEQNEPKPKATPAPRKAAPKESK